MKSFEVKEEISLEDLEELRQECHIHSVNPEASCNNFERWKKEVYDEVLKAQRLLDSIQTKGTRLQLVLRDPHCGSLMIKTEKGKVSILSGSISWSGDTTIEIHSGEDSFQIGGGMLPAE